MKMTRQHCVSLLNYRRELLHTQIKFTQIMKEERGKFPSQLWDVLPTTQGSSFRITTENHNLPVVETRRFRLLLSLDNKIEFE